MSKFKTFLEDYRTSVPIDWNKPDVQIGEAWNEHNVAEFYGKPVKHVESTDVNLSELTPVLAENGDSEQIQSAIDEFSTVYYEWYLGDNYHKLEQKVKQLESVDLFEVEALQGLVDEYDSHIQHYDEYKDDPEELEFWLETTEELEEQIQKESSSINLEDSGYGWDEFNNFHKGVPPVVLLKTNDGYEILDGNHRITYSQDNGYETIGAWVVYPQDK